MKTKLLLLTIFLISTYSFAQTIVSYPQQLANYITFTNGGVISNNGATEVMMEAKNNGKEVAAWRNLTQDGSPGGTASTMNVGDSFTISLFGSRAYGQIGIALLSSPTATATWTDRYNNYAVQLNLNGLGSGSWGNWEIVSSTGSTDTGISGDESTWDGTNIVANEYSFKFTLISTTEMDIIITKDGTPTTFNNITLNTQNITGYSIYHADDWDGRDNINTYWKPTTEYRYATTLSTNNYLMRLFSLNLIENTIQIEGLEYNQKFKLDVYDLNGKLVKQMNEKSNLTINELTPAVYILKLTIEDKGSISKKVIKK